MNKIEIRNDALLFRHSYASALWPNTRNSLEKQLAQIVLPRLIGARVVAGYHPMRDEISPYPILDALGEGQTAVLPWFGDRDEQMMFRQAPATESGPWNVLQPGADAPALAPDVVLVPLVAADRLGTRIGHGKGHYDRALSHLREGNPALVTIGLAWEPQIRKEPLEPDPWDVPLDAIATPAEWIQCK
ncbi:MAG TPA: 5-formyltetrahydrofolate cyclo-ligase [Allosphingosinicella sp.]|uniref:5-formyltetrahydrofolate cyclo-ligase n=1 Tax=Allosphingosinicella sp. TaxID=2823234 RepID=UPI002ED8EACF